MLSFISDNLSTIIVGAVVFAVVAAAVAKILRDRKNHKNTCGGGCCGCPSSEGCRPGSDVKS